MAGQQYQGYSGLTKNYLEFYHISSILRSIFFSHFHISFFFFLFFFKNIYLFIFIWLYWVLVVAHALLSCGTWAPQLWHANSQLWHACGIQFPDQRSNPGPLYWELGVLTTAPPGKSHILTSLNQHISYILQCLTINSSTFPLFIH